MSRVPIRVRLTAAFAAAMLVTLTGAALFVYLRLRWDLDDAVNAQLRARAVAVADRSAAVPLAAVALADPEESFVQVLDSAGRVVAAVGNARGPALDPAGARAAATGAPRLAEASVAGIDGRVRLLAQPSAEGPGAATTVLVVGQSLNDRNEALRGVVASFAGGGTIAVVLASLVGSVLARAGLAPVEAIRRRAVQVSLTENALLPLPVARDEVRRLAETLNHMLARLRDSFERERRFVADASHELRTPVAVIKTELEAALRADDCGPQVREGLVAAVEECDRLTQLADDLLVLARLSQDGLPVRPQPIPARALLEGVRQRFLDRAGQRGRGLHVDVSADLSFVADPDRIRQALANLVDNALRHGHGDITLRCDGTTEVVDLEVSDHGAGFPADVADRAFDRFARGDQARARGGAGLGLAIVAAVAAAHHGTAEIAPGRPATVRLRLPRHP
ncbi:MAG: sensor histidine kinase [Kineosporiaceae bacterium]